MDRTALSVTIAHAGIRLAAVLLAPLAVALLRLFPAVELDLAGGPVWLAPALAASAAALVGIGASVALALGLHGEPSQLGAAAGLGALAAGLAVAALRALDNPGGLPAGGLAGAALAGSVLLFGARLLPGSRLGGGGRVLGAVLAFGAIEAALAIAISLPPPAEARPWLYAGSAALVAAAALGAGSTSTGLLAGGLAALAIGRTGTLEAAPGLLALAFGGIGLAWATFARPRSGRRALPTGADDAHPPPLLGWHSGAGVASPPESQREGADEADRLARELRGTIEELLETRRTVELQRAELARAATTDPLTGVATRRAILERLHVEAAESRRYTHPLAVMLLDVDGFARLNHEHGLEVGDAALRELALRLRLRMRAADALGRAGGDSFLAILPHTDERGATVFADALRRRLTTRPISSAAGELRITVSIGVAFVRPGMSLSDEELLTAVDEALASAKAAGGNRIAFDRLHGLARLDERERGAGDRSTKDRPGSREDTR